MIPLTQNGNVVAKTCERCGQAFTCGPLYTCWCFEMILTDAQRVILEDKFDDCLCQTCLNELSQIL